MGVISIRLSDKLENEIKKKAIAESKNLSTYCKDKILSEEIIEQPLERETIEVEIDKLKRSINRMNNNIVNLSKEILYQNKICNEWIIEMLNYAIDDEEEKKKIFEQGINEADDYIKNLFER